MNINAADAISYVMKVCIKRDIEFSAIYGKFKGRLEFECDDDLWDRLVGSCLCFYDYTFMEEGS